MPRSPTSAALLPNLSLPTLRQSAHPPQPGRVDQCEAWLLLVSPKSAADIATGLPAATPYAEALRRALRRHAPKPGHCITLTLPNERQTLAVIGVLASNAEPFAALQLAGTMCQKAGDRLATTTLLWSVGDAGASRKTDSDATRGATRAEALLAATLAATFALPRFGQRPRRQPLRRVDLHGARIDLPRAAAVARGNNLARWLTALPPNVLDARGYRTLLARVAKQRGLSFRWWGDAALRRAGAGAFLAVAAGNPRRDAGIAQLAYRPRRRGSGSRSGARATADVALVGKGILFDTGGTNLKPHAGMLHMHADMAGSAVALASLLALAELRSPLAADCWLAITENNIGPTAYRPQEVVTASNGTTIQVIHTDAEGRMALADTLALAGRGRPRLILDFATLTGACVRALTERMSGVFTNRPALRDAIEAAGLRSGERVHCFPLPADYDTDLDSHVADVLQCAVDGKGDHILAARFLQRFVPTTSTWVHVDLASAMRTGGLGHVTTDITGFGVRFALDALADPTLLKASPAP
jgi:leucyl aminopeptidase